MDESEKPKPKKERGPNGGAREGAGRPAFEPTDREREQVEAMSGFGVPWEQIAILVRDGIHLETLRKHFDSELIRGKAKANAKVGQSLYQRAIAGDTASAIWWSKTQMRWSETHKLEHTGADGAELKGATIVINPVAVPKDEDT